MADIKRILDYDPSTRTKTTFHYDWKTNDTIFESTQDAQPFLEDNQVWRNHITQDRKSDFRRVASIPLNVFYSIPREIRQDGKALRRWLNNPDNAAFKTWNGTV
jgi:hypothetical protein